MADMMHRKTATGHQAACNDETDAGSERIGYDAGYGCSLLVIFMLPCLPLGSAGMWLYVFIESQGYSSVLSCPIVAFSVFNRHEKLQHPAFRILRSKPFCSGVIHGK